MPPRGFPQAARRFRKINMFYIQEFVNHVYQGDCLDLLPHRPDAFFTLLFAGNPEGKERSHFFYEADRGTENTTRYKLKLRAHWHFIVKQQRQRTEPVYNVPAIRAVL